MKNAHILAIPSAVLLLVACGGGGGGSSPAPTVPTPSVPTPAPPSVSAPSALSYPAHPDFTINSAITPLMPTVSGTVTTYSISPALSFGLALDAATGRISGTPTVLAFPTTYTVTATNSAGSTTTTVNITVNDVPPVVSYGTPAVSYSVGAQANSLAPAVSGGEVRSWTVDPALPAGLALNVTNGVISGTPTAAAARATYRVTAHNSGGDAQADISIAVSSEVLLELGHGRAVIDVLMNAQRVLSIDSGSHVVLWNAQTAAQVFATDEEDCGSECAGRIALAGTTAVLRDPAGFDVRNATTGAVLATVAMPAANGTWWRLADDGSYLCAGGPSGLTVWSPTGTVLLTRAGNYANANAFAATSALRIAAGPAGATVIESIAIPGGAVTVSPAFQGTFHSWFQDGTRFMTHLANNVWVYAPDATQQDLVALPTIEHLAGRGNWLWSADNANLRIYAVGASGTPTATYPVGIIDEIAPSGNVIGILANGSNRVKVVDLAGATPAATDYTMPMRSLSAFAASSASDWAVGNGYGVMTGELPPSGPAQYYSLGKVWSIAGNDQRIALSVASGKILYYDAATRALQGEIPFPAQTLSLSDDGATLMAAAYAEDSPSATVRFYGLPAENVRYERFYDGGVFPNYLYPWLASVTMSRSGDFVGEKFRTTGSFGAYQRDITTISGTTIFSDQYVGDGSIPGRGFSEVALSPSGNRSAISEGIEMPDAATSIRNGATLIGAGQGIAIGWIDENRLLVARYQYAPRLILEFGSMKILDASGQVIGSPPLPEILDFQALGGDLVFSPDHVTVFDVSNGAKRWNTQTPFEHGFLQPGVGAVAAGRAIFFTGSRVAVEAM